MRPAPQRTAEGARPKRKLKKLRLLLLVSVLSVLAVLSTIFGMMMAVSNELPKLEDRAQYRAARNSILFADGGKLSIAHLTDTQNRILLTSSQISPNIKNSVVAIEDQRFYQHQGVDFRGIARAVVEDVLRQKASQGASTITQQFVKNALAAQRDRTVFEKLREAALAYHLERRWSKDKILTEYINTVYFGNGAYGIESAMRTYFGQSRHYTQSDRLAANVSPDQAALLAGLIASPAAYDPVVHPIQATKRRDLVLKKMYAQHLITKAEYSHALLQAIPTRHDLRPPQPESTQPYFSSWVSQQMVQRYGPGTTFGGGLHITTTLDPEMQKAAANAIQAHLAGVGPTASAVVIDNATGGVRAMVGGNDFAHHPFNLATNGHRQPGSAIKPFILATALTHGISPDSVWTSAPKQFVFYQHGRKMIFGVHNFGNTYAGSTTLTSATAESDNSVFATIGLKVGTKKVARMGRKMGLRTRLSTNPAMVLGGLKEGVTPLEMAYAYSTIANDGVRHSGSLASGNMGPVAIEKVTDLSGHTIGTDQVRSKRVYSQYVAGEMKSLLHGVIAGGTGTHAQIAAWAGGKTGTTENYGDAWFVGFTKKYTAAVWVGYPDTLKSMAHDYGGGPVEGGTYPADIWHDLMDSILAIDASHNPGSGGSSGSGSGSYAPSGTSGGPSSTLPQTQTPQQTTPGTGTGGGTGGGQVQPQLQTPAPPPQQQPSPPQQQSPGQQVSPPSPGGGNRTPNGTGQ